MKWLKSTVGKQYDYDLYAAFQCFDYANVGWDKLFGHGLKGNGRKIFLLMLIIKISLKMRLQYIKTHLVFS